jgi:response regulator of citrate/malate metabolism
MKSDPSKVNPTNANTKATISTLVVDDDFMVADIHRRLVERDRRFSVCAVAHSAAEAMRSVKDHQPELILLDIYLPDRNGLDVLRALRSIDADCDVVVISAANDLSTIRSVMRLGGVHFLVKPFDSDALISVLDRVSAMRANTARLDRKIVTQADIDLAYAAMRPPPGGALPKGFSPVTQQLVLKALHVDVEKSAVEVGEATGISRVSARRYLELLVDNGQAELRLRYGVTGRPEHQYRLAASELST